MSAENYNKIRRILFSTANKPNKGFSVAYEWMESTYCKQLDLKSYYGLMTELKFYECYKNEFYLTVAGDTGEHADFAGIFGSQPARFDVTTNINFKNFLDYEPYMGSGPIYKVALLDQGSFDVIDVLDLAFPRCNCCGGYLIPTIVLLDQNYNRHGESQWNNDQLLIDVCTGCEEYTENHRYIHSGLFSASEYYDFFGGDVDLAEKAKEQHVISAYKYFRRQHSDYLMAVGSHNYIVTMPKGGGHWAINFNFVNSAVSREMPIEIVCSHEI
ncbi:MAG: hypothetical protein FXF49_10040 [Flexistipes sinusarabici]|uniref:Uncharacterized protein n=1 Tax=Flexistipes sinusarabici TaxID=2352 RepID=A0A5D0MIB7_FLESI|nr:hypothetical protein [Flexistipes sinusarabici]TYB32726.1 MAG: hypothetical protein FXF49_10040 [Flexistipes sinusarabici]